MPKRKLLKTSTETIHALKEARQRGHQVTEAEWAAHQERVSRGAVNHLSSGAIVVERRGKLVFRRAVGKPGPDYEEHPLTIDIKKRERDLLTETAKFRRRPPTDAATKARQAKPKRLQVLELLKQYSASDRNAAALIARQVGVHPGYVREIRRKAKLTEGNP